MQPTQKNRALSFSYDTAVMQDRVHKETHQAIEGKVALDDTRIIAEIYIVTQHIAFSDKTKSLDRAVFAHLANLSNKITLCPPSSYGQEIRNALNRLGQTLHKRSKDRDIAEIFLSYGSYNE